MAHRKQHSRKCDHFIEGFAALSRTPVRTGTNVTSVRAAGGGYRVTTSRGEIACRAVVIAGGACNRPVVPPSSDAVPPSVEQLTLCDYREPGRLPDGGVLVVGASATGGHRHLDRPARADPLEGRLPAQENRVSPRAGGQRRRKCDVGVLGACSRAPTPHTP
ncbi:NAD(P)-binding domain-containing protein [Nonomuraea helvata]|uniref:NAD(P)-binding domain-containing protein n=1 Tax=Nonomuraea helvata TaxID=37484 RepID=A0ABV5SA11_9ACTN